MPTDGTWVQIVLLLLSCRPLRLEGTSPVVDQLTARGYIVVEMDEYKVASITILSLTVDLNWEWLCQRKFIKKEEYWQRRQAQRTKNTVFGWRQMSMTFFKVTWFPDVIWYWTYNTYNSLKCLYARINGSYPGASYLRSEWTRLRSNSFLPPIE
jgi:hypothetical protein